MELNIKAIRRNMENYLEYHGYPDISNETIMQKHLVPMFKLLVAKGLVNHSLFYIYQEAATEQYMIAKMRGIF